MATVSKREQARNERELQDLLRLPGNNQCADCSARNPAWASWNLGIFLCMRCASIHRKLGTHISKVKSLSMDKWSSDQVEAMKQRGNSASNKHYNPKNKKPDIPLDADEVDSAMERFIRKKYQEKSLVDGRPEPPSRADVSPSRTQTPQPSPMPDLPATGGKKHKFFGFSLRTSSKKERPGAENAFKITPVEYSPTTGYTREVPDRELQEKLAQLRDMGFSDNERNLNILKRSGGDLERAIATLVKLGPAELTRKQTASPAPSRPAEPAAASSSAPPTAALSNNPWGQLDSKSSHGAGEFGISLKAPHQQQAPAPAPAPAPSANPWQAALPTQQPTGLEQQFSGMQVSNPLFPHRTGGYSGQPAYQNDPGAQTLILPVPTIPQQYSYPPSPIAAVNPFYQQQQPLSSQSTGNNPFLQQQQSQPSFAPSTNLNPFLMQQAQPQPQPGFASSSNPFGLPPNQPQNVPQQYMSSHQNPSTNPFGIPQQSSPQSQQSQQLQHAQTFPLTQQSSYTQAQSLQPQLSNFNYGQPQAQIQQPQQQSEYGQPQPQFQPQQQQPAFHQNQQPQSYPQTQPPPPAIQLQPQQTGRYTKNDIMALFSQPAPMPQHQALASIPEPADEQAQSQPQQYHQPQQQQIPQQTLSPTPSANPYGNSNALPGKRASTMPTQLSSAGTSRNPFLSTASTASSRNPSAASMSSVPFGQQQSNPFGQLQPQQQMGYGGQQPLGWNQGTRHASNESVSVNNPTLMDGRHSPDAFASLSARY